MNYISLLRCLLTYLLVGRPSVKRFALCYWTVVCSVCNISALWPNGWMDQNKTRHAGRSRSRPHCVVWGPSFPPKGHSPQFSAHVCCGQTAGWINMPLGTEIDLGPGHIVLDGDPPPKGNSSPPLFFGPCLLWPRSPISATAELALVEFLTFLHTFETRRSFGFCI